MKNGGFVLYGLNGCLTVEIHLIWCHCREVKIRVNVEVYGLSAGTKINGRYTEVAIIGGLTVSQKLV